VIDLPKRRMHVLAGMPGTDHGYHRVCSIPFDTNAEINWLMIENFKLAPSEFDANKIFFMSTRPRTSFERVLDDDDLV
jgi:hypothetical protein